MFDIGWSEMAIIMVLALIVIGPKDLPRVARTIGQWVRKGRMLAREFQTSLEDMAKEAELDDVKKEIEKVGATDLKKTVENTIDPKGELTKAFDTSTETPSSNGDTKALNGSAKTSDAAQTTASPSRATDAKAKASTAKSPAKPAAGKAKSVATAKKPASTSKKPATPKTSAAKKPPAPKKRAAKPSATAKSGAGDKPADDAAGDTAMTAKSS